MPVGQSPIGCLRRRPIVGGIGESLRKTHPEHFLFFPARARLGSLASGIKWIPPNPTRSPAARLYLDDGIAIEMPTEMGYRIGSIFLPDLIIPRRDEGSVYLSTYLICLDPHSRYRKHWLGVLDLNLEDGTGAREQANVGEISDEPPANWLTCAVHLRLH